ncbi:MAG: hypothetical protein AAGL23_15505 [Pseudomonadota bacterium]
MTDGVTQTRNGPKTETLIFGVIVVVAIALLIYLSGQRQQALRTSPVGFDGLQVWLTSSDLPAQNFTGGWVMDPDNVDLLVMPLFDTALDARRDRPETKEDLLFQQDEADQRASVLREKAGDLTSLVVLPKWRSGMRLTGLGHPALLVEGERLEGVLEDLTGEAVRLGRVPVPFTDFDYLRDTGERLRARLYVAQVFDSPDCEPIIGRRGQMILGSCPLEGSDKRVMILSDPDLFNNHGLRLGDNANIARAFFAPFSDEGQIVIDYSDGNWFLSRSGGTTRDRTWADLLRFFEPPFLAMWLSAGLILALLLWRASLRYGPVAVERADMSASKAQAIAAQARLSRLTGQDGALLTEYASARLSSVVVRLFGPAQTRAGRDRDLLLRHLGRHDPPRAAALTSVLETIDRLPPGLSARDAITHVDALEDILEEVTHDT